MTTREKDNNKGGVSKRSDKGMQWQWQRQVRAGLRSAKDDNLGGLKTVAQVEVGRGKYRDSSAFGSE